jgi:hypothetical protein
MKNIFAVVMVFLAAASCSLCASEDAGKMLKVPAAVDRPVADAVPVTEPKIAEPDPSPSASPSPSPESEQPAAPAQATQSDPSAEAGAEPIVPEPYPVSRYAALWENSPFQIESIAPPVQSEGLAQRFVLGGFHRVGGEYRVLVRERATQKSYVLAKGAPNKESGLLLVEVAESPGKQSDATATIRLGGELGVIKFDAAPTGMSPGMAPPPVAMRPTVPAPVVPQQPVTGRPGAVAASTVIPPTTQPGGNPAIAQPGIVPPVPGPGIPQSAQVQSPGQEPMPPPRVIRRRAIVPAAP